MTGSSRRASWTRFKGTDVLFDELLVPSLARSHADLMSATSDADLLVTHPAALAGVIVAEERRLPWASSVLAPMSFFSASDPMVPPPAPWVHAWLARSPLLSRLALQLVRRTTQKWAAPVAAFRASRGLPPRGNPILEGQHSPHLVLALFSKLLAEPQPDWPPHVRVTGAVLYNGAGAVEMPADLGEFLDSGPPPIVFTLGTSAIASAGDFYEVSAAAVETLNRRAVLLVGPHARNRPRTLSDRIFLAEFVPHALVFPRAAAIVHQGGAGTMHQALASGRPTIVVPHAHDQPDNARRVTALGVARTIYPRQYRVARLAADLRALIEQPDTRHGPNNAAPTCSRKVVPQRPPARSTIYAAHTKSRPSINAIEASAARISARGPARATETTMGSPRSAASDAIGMTGAP